MDPLLISVEEAAKALSISRTAAYGLLYERKLVSVKVGRRRLVSVRSLEAFVDGLAAAEAVEAERTAQVLSIPARYRRSA